MINSAELKKKLAEKLKLAADKMDAQQKMQAAVNLKISLKTFERYTSGNVDEVRRLELAEQILAEISQKKTAKAEA